MSAQLSDDVQHLVTEVHHINQLKIISEALTGEIEFLEHSVDHIDLNESADT